MAGLNLIYSAQSRAPARPWPVSGCTYYVLLEVEHVGLHYTDDPHIEVMCHAGTNREADAINAIFSDHHYRDLFDSDSHIHASGFYRAEIEFWHDIGRHHTHYGAEDGEDDNYGFILRKLERF